jgi:hypothetical protein
MGHRDRECSSSGSITTATSVLASRRSSPTPRSAPDSLDQASGSGNCGHRYELWFTSPRRLVVTVAGTPVPDPVPRVTELATLVPDLVVWSVLCMPLNQGACARTSQFRRRKMHSRSSASASAWRLDWCLGTFRRHPGDAVQHGQHNAACTRRDRVEQLESLADPGIGRGRLTHEGLHRDLEDLRDAQEHPQGGGALATLEQADVVHRDVEPLGQRSLAPLARSSGSPDDAAEVQGELSLRLGGHARQQTRDCQGLRPTACTC